MGILELQIVLLLEILSYSALHGLAVFKLEGEAVEKRNKPQCLSRLNVPHRPLQTGGRAADEGTHV